MMPPKFCASCRTLRTRIARLEAAFRASEKAGGPGYSWADMAARTQRAERKAEGLEAALGAQQDYLRLEAALRWALWAVEQKPFPLSVVGITCVMYYSAARAVLEAD